MGGKGDGFVFAQGAGEEGGGRKLGAQVLFFGSPPWRGWGWVSSSLIFSSLNLTPFYGLHRLRLRDYY